MHRNPNSTPRPEDASLVWFYEISKITLKRVPRFTNSEDFRNYVWFLIKRHCKVYLTKRALNSERQSLPKVSCCPSRIVLWNLRNNTHSCTRYTNAEDFWKYVWFLIKRQCKVHLTERAPNSENQGLSKVSCCLFRIVLSDHEKCLRGVYRGSPNIVILKNCWKL